MNFANILPADAGDAVLVGRIRLPGVAAPAVCVIRNGDVITLDRANFLTISDVLEAADPAGEVSRAKGQTVGPVEQIIANTLSARSAAEPCFLAPCDLQALKATGVTFIRSLLERLIEEQSKGDPSRAGDVRRQIEAEIGTDLSSVEPGSEKALELRRIMQARNAWSPYLEVGLGPDCELFTKSQPMSAVGTGADIGIHPELTWSNPEPEIVLAVNSRDEIVGAALGNDVNLRDFEGRSTLLLGRAKDNNASCAIGPFLRLFDGRFTLDTIRSAKVELVIEGPDGFRLADTTSMSAISRDPAEIVRQSTGPNHPYPDGLMMFLGAMFAPTQDRDEPGRGFTHKRGDVVRISTPSLGTLRNRVDHCDKVDPWTFGLNALIRSLTEAQAERVSA